MLVVFYFYFLLFLALLARDTRTMQIGYCLNWDLEWITFQYALLGILLTLDICKHPLSIPLIIWFTRICNMLLITQEWTRLKNRILPSYPYHSSRIIMVSMNTEHWQADIEVWVFKIYMTKSVKEQKSRFQQ